MLHHYYSKLIATHQPRVIFDQENKTRTQLFWDTNGNLSQLLDCQREWVRFHDWDDENRLRVALDNTKAGYYGYDAYGDRVYKLTGTSTITHLGDDLSSAYVDLDTAILYPNPYVTITPKEYTKHYYANGERLATSIGAGGWCHMSPDVIDEPKTEHEMYLQKEWINSYIDKEYPFEYPQEDQPILIKNEDIFGNAYDEIQYVCPNRRLVQLEVKYSPDMLLNVMNDNCDEQSAEDDIFYRHSDHLGSASWITEHHGDAIQYLHYMPYGQLLVNQMPYGYDERYKFTGKERDAETGYDYFGARYYAPLLLHWTTVDPLADKYPGISPYAYCSWNPIKYIDPDGKDAILITFPNYKAEYKGFHIPYTGHSAVLLINNKNGLTKYYEYGRYGDKIGKARNKPVPNITIKDGVPTLESLNEVLKNISGNFGDNGDIEGAYVKSAEFDAMMKYAEGVVSEASNPERTPYDLFKHNCATFAEDVITQDESVKKPTIFIHTPINTVEEYQENGNARVFYNSQTQETSLGQ